ncbi:MAG: polysaccharide deacetylase family protein [Clostridia bacterium]|nr:polysaccharide deacetylase family protein [Clostridia bacterium]
MRVIMITKKGLITGICILIALVTLIIVLVSSGKDETAQVSADFRMVEAYELTVSTANKKVLPVYSVNRTDKKIALTIDAAWEDDKTPFILETLKKYDVRATFFLCGFWVDKYPDMVKNIDTAGHEIGNHSSTHPHMNSLCSEQIQTELREYDDKLEKITGKRSVLFRAPYGEYNDNVVNTVREMGYEVIQWSIDTIDWREERSADTIIETVMGKLKDGAIILCHNNGFQIKTYLPQLIEKAQAQGYEFVTVSELLLDGETIIDVNGVQKQVAQDT